MTGVSQDNWQWGSTTVKKKIAFRKQFFLKFKTIDMDLIFNTIDPNSILEQSRPKGKD